MNIRLMYATLAVASVLIASILPSGVMVFTGALLYRWLLELSSPAVAASCLIFGALVLAAGVVLLGHHALRCALAPRGRPTSAPQTADQLIAGELVRLTGGSPIKLLVTSLGVGFALGVSPRLRRSVYRTLLD